jgi:ketosteroid isomerase-like protein
MDAKDMSAIERRLQALEDQIAIYQVVCGYGYAIDGCNAEAVGSLYAEDGVYAVADSGTRTGRKQVAGIASEQGHLSLVKGGCAHVSTLPYVVIDGDRASATCHTMVVRHGEDGFYVFRLSASRLELSRKAGGGWHIDHRQNYMLQGDKAGPALLARLQDGPRKTA